MPTSATIPNIAPANSPLGDRRAADGPSPLRLGQVIEMATTGVWVVKRDGVLAAIGGRMCWPDRASLEQAAARAGIALSDIAVHTGAMSGGALRNGRP
ncbi:hypothetical protein [Azospirillum sp. TSO35-2]|uniref:hypothetical protein n=1 Tax=Azospirillum sp. TSO35-2 TaxID=716796 RepID=UPI000D620CEA|nr:hypothetical protein [Azospirillum sp. TSO35-2]PWC36461.1 hypothetical protein TSO352_15320 [Azospirillum sp. TSO35-2]